MHDIRRLGLQVFAAPNNLTGEAQIQVKAREIDFVTSFGKNLQALLENIPGNECRVTYGIRKDGALTIHMEYEADEKIKTHEMPEFGMLLRIPEQYDKVTYYGYGPEENYWDRRQGSRLGKFHFSVKENLSEYLAPQESGGRSGVREAVIEDENGYGLRISAEEMDLSALPYTPHELENARHLYELPDSEYTILYVDNYGIALGKPQDFCNCL